MQLHNLDPRPTPAGSVPGCTGASRPLAKPVCGRVRAPEMGSAPVPAMLCRRPSAAGARAREEGTRGCAYLPLLTDKSRSVQRLARACLAADLGKPGATRSTPGRASVAGLVGLARRKAQLRGIGRLRARRLPLSTTAGPARPAPSPQLASLWLSSATRAGRQRGGRHRGRPRARLLAARRSQPQPPGFVLLRCPHLLQLSSARSGCWGQAEGAESGREQEGAGGKSLQPLPGPSYSAEPGGWRRRRREPRACLLCARLAPRRAEPRPAGGGGGGGGAGPGLAACVGWGIWSEWRSPLPPTRVLEEEEKEVEGAPPAASLRGAPPRRVLGVSGLQAALRGPGTC
jgi:hypothetical protein